MTLQGSKVEFKPSIAELTQTVNSVSKEAIATTAAMPRQSEALREGGDDELRGAAGAVEAVFTVLALARGTPPPTLNLEQPDPDGLGFTHVRLGASAGATRPLRAALSNSFGFGGVNGSALFVAAPES